MTKNFLWTALVLGGLLSAQSANAEYVDIDLTLDAESAVVTSNSHESAVSFSCKDVDDFSFVGDTDTIYRVSFDALDGVYAVRGDTSVSVTTRFSPAGTTCTQTSFAGIDSNTITGAIVGTDLPDVSSNNGSIRTDSFLNFNASLLRGAGYVFSGYTFEQDNLSTGGNTISGAQTYQLCECTVKFSSSNILSSQPVATYGYPVPPTLAEYEPYEGDVCGDANGVILHTGSDDGGGDFRSSTFWDGRLQNDERSGTFTFCEGSSEGSAGSLFATESEPAGDNCEFGGLKITSGVDDDGSETLEDGEVDSTGYVCNGSDSENGAPGADGENGAPGTDGAPGEDGTPGTPGAPGTPGTSGPMGEAGEDGKTGLVTVTPEAAGANCATGGVRVATGVDADDSGALDESEISETSYVCSGAAVVSGSGGCAVGASESSSWSLLGLLAMVGLAIRRKR